MDLFDNPFAQLQGLRIQTPGMATTGGVSDCPGSTFASFHHDRSRKRQAAQATKRVKSEAS
jgi:hypothetical protein